MRKLASLTAAAAMVAVFGFAGTAQAQVETVDLWADGGDGGFSVGMVEVFDNGDGTFDVVYTTDDPYRLVEVHTDADDDDDCTNVPHTRKGSPKVGKFASASEFALDSDTATATHTVTAAYDFCVAAHAVIFDPSQLDLENEDLDTLGEVFDETEETAWGDGEEGTEFTVGRDWSTHFLVTDPEA